MRDEIARAWAQNPRRVVLSVIATILFVPAAWFATVSYIAAFS